MTFKTLMVIKAVVCLVFGVLLVLVPGQLLKLLGATLGAGGMLTSREYGSCLLGNLMLCWFARNAERSPVRRAIILHLFVYDAVALIATLIAQLSGVMNTLGWSIVAVYFFFAAGFGYLLIQRERETPELAF